MKSIFKICLIAVMMTNLSACKTDNSPAFKTQDAVSFVIEKVQQHDIIIFGEMHWVTEQIDFFANIIPVLYENGIRVFAFEILYSGVQHWVDSLIYNDTYDTLLQNVILAQFPMVLMTPYENILYQLWKLQQKIGLKNEKIKVLAIGPRPMTLEMYENYLNCLGYELTDLEMSFVDAYILPPQPEFVGACPDSVMAEIVLNHYRETEAKTVVFCGANHGITRCYQYELFRDEMEPMVRMGNILANELQEKVFSINILPILVLRRLGRTDFEMCFSRLNDYIEKHVLSGMIGFDLDASFFQNYDGELTVFPDFSTETCYDGAIFIKPRKELTVASFDNEWLIERLPIGVKLFNLQMERTRQRHLEPSCECRKREKYLFIL